MTDRFVAVRGFDDVMHLCTFPNPIRPNMVYVLWSACGEWCGATQTMHRGDVTRFPASCASCLQCLVMSEDQS